MALHEDSDMGDLLRLVEAARSEVGSAGSPHTAESRPAKSPPHGQPNESSPQERNASAQERPAEARGRRSRKRPLLWGGGLIAFAASAAAGCLYWDYAGRFESTDDAFIAARQFSVAPKVSGYLTAVAVTDNQHVAAGDVLARIDDRDYRVALAEAEAQVAAAADNIHNIDAQIGVAQAQVAQASAQVDQ